MSRDAHAPDVERGFELVRRLLVEAEAVVARDRAAAAEEADAAEPSGSLERTQRRLLAVLDELEAMSPPDPERRIGFALAAIADEWLLNRAAWPGQAQWTSLLLEQALFGTRVAGERFFELADDVAAAPTGRDRTLAAVLLSGLLIGFEGRYRGGPTGAPLGSYRDTLYRTVFGRPVDGRGDPLDLLATPRAAVAPEAPLRTLPSLKPYVAALIILVLGYVVGAHLIWSAGVRPLLALAAEIVATGSAATGPPTGGGP